MFTFSRNVGSVYISSSSVFIGQCGQTGSYKDGPIRPSVCVFSSVTALLILTNFDVTVCNFDRRKCALFDCMCCLIAA